MGYDAYCALCSGPLNLGAVSFGSRRPEKLEKRRKQVAKEIRDRMKRRLGEACSPEDDGNDDDDDDDDDNDDEMEDADEAEDEKEPDVPNPFAKQAEPSWGDTDDEDEDDEMEDDYEISASSSDSESLRSTDSDFYPGGIADVRRRTPSPEPRTLRDPDCWSQWSELSVQSFDPYKSHYNDGGRMDAYEERHAYDPEKLQADEVRWLNRSRVLAFNPNAPGITKAFISGQGRYDGYGNFSVRKPGHDPNDDHGDDLSCYHAYNPDQIPCFPFHEECYKILAKVLGYEKYQAIDRDVLYAVMTAHSHDRGLELPYGDISGTEQFWDCIPGEEFSVSNPGPRLGFGDVLQSLLPASLFDELIPSPPLSDKVQYDPWQIVPYDLLLEIFEHVSTDDMLALMNASSHVLAIARNMAFWKHMLRLRILPWFWELNMLLNTATLPERFDYKGLFVWINKVTSPEYGMEGPFMGIANRRRTWEACQSLVPMYKHKVAPISHAEPENGEAKALLDRAESFHMPIVSYPLPKGATTVSAQLIRSWHEISHRACIFDTYWNDDGALIGIAVKFGATERVLGSTEGKRSMQLHIEAHEWIKEVRVSLKKNNMFGDEENIDRSHYSTAMYNLESAAGRSYIAGMELVLTSGRSKEIHPFGLDTRPLIVLPDMYLIGLTGQIGPDGVISRLGLLQSYHPEHVYRTPKPSYTHAQKTLWGPSAWDLWPGSDDQQRKPIWHNQFYHLHTFTSGNIGYDGGSRPAAILPHHILLWSETAKDLKNLRRVSTFSIVAGEASTGSGERWHVPDLLGFTFYRKGAWVAEERAIHEPWGTVGTFGPVPCQAPEWKEDGRYGSEKWTDEHGNPVKPLNPSDLKLGERYPSFDEKHMLHFEVDGAGGEEVTEVHVSQDFKAVKLKTNRGRECYWGEGRRSSWFTKIANDKEYIAGLSVCFGKLGGYSWRAKMHSHWKLSELGVVMAGRDGGMWQQA